MISSERLSLNRPLQLFQQHHLGSCCRRPGAACHVLWVRRRGTCLQALDQILRQRLWSVIAATPAAASHARARRSIAAAHRQVSVQCTISRIGSGTPLYLGSFSNEDLTYINGSVLNNGCAIFESSFISHVSMCTKRHTYL